MRVILVACRRGIDENEKDSVAFLCTFGYNTYIQFKIQVTSTRFKGRALLWLIKTTELEKGKKRED
jgi:hypothetical protein